MGRTPTSEPRSRNAVAANGGEPVTFGSPDGPRYVAGNGALLGYVGTGAIPAAPRGSRWPPSRTWRPYFLGIIGMNDWTATTVATAKGGYSLAGPPPGSLFPAGISLAFFQTYPFCSRPGQRQPGDPCYPQHLTPGNLNVPGGFGWLKFGCDGMALARIRRPIGGCANTKPFLQSEIGPPSQQLRLLHAGRPARQPDRIGSLPGNKVSADCSYYIDNEVTVTVPIWDTAGGTGSNGWYHIVGFAGFQITECRAARTSRASGASPSSHGPTTITPTGPSVAQALGVQLVR